VYCVSRDLLIEKGKNSLTFGFSCTQTSTSGQTSLAVSCAAAGLVKAAPIAIVRLMPSAVRTQAVITFCTSVQARWTKYTAVRLRRIGAGGHGTVADGGIGQWYAECEGIRHWTFAAATAAVRGELNRVVFLHWASWLLGGEMPRLES
jgi:hypothetical protein